jgi:tRNA(fMet)-specific endonuclease VapC
VILHLDTSFVVDLLREAARERKGPASTFLQQHLEDELQISVFVACELWLGVERSDRGVQERRRVDELMTAVPVTLPGAALPAVYGRTLASLQRRGEVIATMDLLIASSALVEGVALVTRNASHFERVPDLKLLSY